MEEFLEAFGLDQLVEDRLAPFAGKGDFLAVTLDPLFEPSGLLGVGNMHVLQREGAAIGALHDLEDLAHRGHLQAQHIVDEDRAIHIGIGEAVGFRIKLGVGGGLAHAQRVEIGDQMATDAVGADDHQRADTVENGALDLRIGHFDALGLGFRLDLVACAFDLGCGLRPFAGEGCGQVIGGGGRPVAPRPAWALRLGLRVGGCVAKGREKRAPCLVNRARVLGVLRVELFKIRRVMPLHEGGGVELVVRALVGHGCT